LGAIVSEQSEQMEQSDEIDLAGSALRVHLPPLPASVPGARRAVGSLCRSAGLDGAADDAELLTSELMTNACRVSEGFITLVASLNDDGVLITVIDDNPNDIDPPVPPDADADTGRGLFLIDQLAGSWGISRQRDRKAVWFRLP
jgi:anti-sigma regulatory factor (Ser/Thr protein kinase)